MTSQIDRSARRRASLTGSLALGGMLVLSGCAGPVGGRRPAPATAAAPPAGPSQKDTLQTEAANRRLLSAAALDDLDLSTPPPGYRVGPNDVVDVEVFGVEAFSGSFPVAETGEIAIPLLGPVGAEGSTVRELEDVLEARLRETYVRDPHVTVRVAEMQSHGVSVIGAVRRPGVYQVAGRRTLLEVLAMAEGLTAEAGSTVLLVRPGRASGATEPSADSSGATPATPVDSTMSGDSATLPPDLDEHVVEVDLGALLESGRTEENLVVQPGDIVQVRPAGIVYVVGEVNRPGGFPVPPGEPMTVLQAMALAQGLGSRAAPGRTVIVRESSDGMRQELPVDLEEVLDGSANPPLLAERDVLFVPKSGAKSFALGAIDALVRMVTFRGLVY